MFDDQKPQTSGQPPRNLPIANMAEDMFSGTNDNVPAPISSPSISKIPSSVNTQDLPSDSVNVNQDQTSAVSAGVLKPKVVSTPVLDDPLALDDNFSPSLSSPNLSPVDSKSAMSAPPSDIVPASITVPPPIPSEDISQSSIPSKLPADLYAIKEPKTGRFLFMSIVAFVGVVIFLLVVWWVYARFVRVDLPEVVPTNEATNIISPPLFEDESFDNDTDVDSTLSGNQIDDTILFGQPVDTDGDGLDDERELSVGTDIDNWDTDGDQLSDGDEVIIWKTDPLNQDTDGDTYFDGAEVRSGYSPTGGGRIFEPPVVPVDNETSTNDSNVFNENIPEVSTSTSEDFIF